MLASQVSKLKIIWSKHSLAGAKPNPENLVAIPRVSFALQFPRWVRQEKEYSEADGIALAQPLALSLLLILSASVLTLVKLPP